MPIPPHLIERAKATRPGSPARTLPTTLAPPPEEDASLGEKVKNWVLSKEGGGATALQVGAPAAAYSAGALGGAAVTGPLAPVGAIIGGGLAGGTAGYYASKKAQEMRGQEFSHRQALAEGALDALPPFIGRTGKTVSQIVGRQAAKYGLLSGSGAGLSEVSRASDIEGYEVEPLNVALAAAFGSAVGGGLSVRGARALTRAGKEAGTPSAPAPRFSTADRQAMSAPSMVDDVVDAAQASTARAGETSARRSGKSPAQNQLKVLRGLRQHAKTPEDGAFLDMLIDDLEAAKAPKAPAAAPAAAAKPAEGPVAARPVPAPEKATQLIDPTTGRVYGGAIENASMDPDEAVKGARQAVREYSKKLSEDLGLEKGDKASVTRWFGGTKMDVERMERLQRLAQARGIDLEMRFNDAQADISALLVRSGLTELPKPGRVGGRQKGPPKGPKLEHRIRYRTDADGKSIADINTKQGMANVKRGAERVAAKLEKQYPGSEAKVQTLRDKTGEIVGWRVTSRKTRAEAKRRIEAQAAEQAAARARHKNVVDPLKDIVDETRPAPAPPPAIVSKAKQAAARMAASAEKTKGRSGLHGKPKAGEGADHRPGYNGDPSVADRRSGPIKEAIDRGDAPEVDRVFDDRLIETNIMNMSTGQLRDIRSRPRSSYPEQYRPLWDDAQLTLEMRAQAPEAHIKPLSPEEWRASRPKGSLHGSGKAKVRPIPDELEPPPGRMDEAPLPDEEFPDEMLTPGPRDSAEDDFLNDFERSHGTDYEDTLPAGSSMDDYQAVPMSDKTMAEDFVDRLAADYPDTEFWVSPARSRKVGKNVDTGAPVVKGTKGWQVMVDKHADISDLTSEYGVGRKQAQPAPGEAAVVPRRARSLSSRPDSRAGLNQPLEPMPDRVPTPYTPPAKSPGSKALQENLIRPPERAASIDPDTDAAMREKLRDITKGHSTEALERAAKNAPDERVRQAALDEIEARQAGKVEPDAGTPEGNAEVVAQTQKLADLRASVRKAGSNAGGIRRQIRATEASLMRLLEKTGSETGEWKFWPTPKHNQMEPNVSQPKMDRLEKKQAGMILGGTEIEQPGAAGNLWRKFGNRAFALQEAVIALEERGNILGPDNNIWKLFINNKDRGLGEFHQAAREVTELVGEATKRGLGKIGRRAFNLMNFIREERTFAGNLQRTTRQWEEAADALNSAKANKVKPKEMKRAIKLERARKKSLDKADRNWKQLARGKGLPEEMKPGEASGMLTELRDATPPKDWDLVEKVMRGWAHANDRALGVEQLMGRHVTQDMVDEFRARGPYLSPLSRHLDNTTRVLRTRIKTAVQQKLIDPKQAEIMQELAGDPSVPIDPFTGGLRHLEMMYREAHHSSMVRQMVDSLREFEPYSSSMKKVSEGAPTDPNMAKVPVFRNGPKPEYWTVPRAIAEVMMSPTGLEMELYGLGPMRTLLQRSKNALTKSAVVYSMGFGFGRNPGRDIKSARTWLPDVYKLNHPTDVMATAKEYFSSVGSLMFEGSKNPWTGKVIGSDIASARRTGVFNSTLQVSFNPKLYLHDKWYKALGIEGTEIPNPLSRTVGGVGNSMATLTGHMENATKLMTWRRFAESGYHPEEALYLTKMFGGSPNFSLGGEHKKVLDLMLMFFNPGIQGQAQTVMGLNRLAKLQLGAPTPAQMAGETLSRGSDDTAKFWQNAVKKVGGNRLTQFTMTLAAGALIREKYNRQYVDEDGKAYIERIDPNFRENNWIMFLPIGMQDTRWGEIPTYVSMPKAHVQMLIGTPFERAAAYLAGERDTEFTSGTGFLEHVAEQVLPLGGQIDVDRSLPSNLADNLMATAVPIIGASASLRENRDPRTGNPIISDQILESRRPEDRYTERTMEPVKQLTGQLRKYTGNLLGLEPWAVDYFLKKQFPAQYWAVKAGDEMIRYGSGIGQEGGRGRDVNINDTLSRIPGFGDIYRNFFGPGSAPPAELMRLRDIYYRDREHAQQQQGSAKFLSEAEEDPGMEMEIISDGKPMDMFLSDMLSTDRDLAELRHDRSTLERRRLESFDEDERKQLLRQIQGINEMEMLTLRQYNSIRKSWEEQ